MDISLMFEKATMKYRLQWVLREHLSSILVPAVYCIIMFLLNLMKDKICQSVQVATVSQLLIIWLRHKNMSLNNDFSFLRDCANFRSFFSGNFRSQRAAITAKTTKEGFASLRRF
jgi:hypothetical protein